MCARVPGPGFPSVPTHVPMCYVDISVHEYVNVTGVSVGSLSLYLGREPGTFNSEGL